MTERAALGGMSEKIVVVHEQLESLRVVHQFGGAIALAWYRTPRATIDIDVNLTLPVEQFSPVLGALAHLDVTVTEVDRRAVEMDGQVRLDWRGTYLDLFFATLPLHYEMAERARKVGFASATIPILSPEDLTICKAVFDRPKDWVDIEAMVGWGTPINSGLVLSWIERLLGVDSTVYSRIREILPKP
jgi:hypothetical protein